MKTTKSSEPLIVDDVLLSAEQLSRRRWPGMHPRIIAAKLKEWGVPAIRLGSRTIKYRLSDIVRVENEAATRTMADFRKKKAETGQEGSAVIAASQPDLVMGVTNARRVKAAEAAQASARALEGAADAK